MQYTAFHDNSVQLARESQMENGSISDIVRLDYSSRYRPLEVGRRNGHICLARQLEFFTTSALEDG